MPSARPIHPAIAPILAIALLLAAAAFVVPRAGAAVIASSVPGFEGGPALAGDGRVVVGERRGNGALRVFAIDPRTGVQTGLTSFGPLGDPTTYPELNITGSGAIVTMTRDEFRQVGAGGGEQAQPTPLSTRALTLLPSLVPLGACGPPLRTAFPELDAAGGEGFVATVGDACGVSRSAVLIRTANGNVTIPAPSGTGDASYPPDIYDLHATGPMLAWVQAHLDTGSQVQRELVVASGATGRILLRIALDGELVGLGADGTAVLSSFPGCALRVVSPAAPVPRSLQLPAGLCPGPATSRGQGAVALAGGRIAYAAGSGYAVTDPGGGAHPLADARINGLIGSPVAFDGRTVFVVRADCDADRLLAVDASVAGPALPPASGPASCPVRRAGPGRLRVGRDGRVSIGLRCAAGCRGTLRLVEQRRGRRERLAGSGDYTVAAGKVVVRAGLARWSRRLAGCAGGLRVTAIVHPVGPDHVSATAGRGKGLGAYRLLSRARCRRGGGPAFTAPRPGPRPRP
jgi:hypothetical protein